MLSGICEFLKKSGGYINPFIWLILLCISGLSFVGFFYGDLESTLDNTVLLAKAMREGEFFHFYEYSLEHAQTYWPAGYDILLYIFFAIWNLPSIIWHLITGEPYLDQPLILLWCKGLTVVFAAGTAWAVCRIIRLLGMGKKEGILAAFLMLSSLSLIAPVFIAGQYDTLPLFFMLLGLYYYLKDKDMLFLLCFTISIPLKVYGLFLVVPLVLLKEKRIWAGLLKIGGTCSLYILLKLLFIKDTVYPFISSSQGQYGVDKLLNSAVTYSGYSFCLFLGCYAAICIFCYWKKLADSEERRVYPLYICFLVFAVFVTLVSINDYWVIFYLPFAVLVILLNKTDYKLNVLIETASAGMYLLYAFTLKVYPYSYPDLVTERFFRLFMSIPDEGERMYGSIKTFMEYAGMEPYAQLFHSLFVVGIISLIIINRPGKVTRTLTITDGSEQGEDSKVFGEQGILWSRILIICAVIVLLVYSGLKGGNPVIYTTLDYNYVQPEINLLDGAVYAQDLVFENECFPEELVLHFANDGYVKDNFGSVWIRVTDKSSGQILFEERRGASTIEPGRACRIRLSGLELNAGRKYTLSLEGVPGMKESNYFLCPRVTEDFIYGYHLFVNGERQNGNLYMQIR